MLRPLVLSVLRHLDQSHLWSCHDHGHAIVMHILVSSENVSTVKVRIPAPRLHKFPRRVEGRRLNQESQVEFCACARVCVHKHSGIFENIKTDTPRYKREWIQRQTHCQTDRQANVNVAVQTLIARLDNSATSPPSQKQVGSIRNTEVSRSVFVCLLLFASNQCLASQGRQHPHACTNRQTCIHNPLHASTKRTYDM